MIKYLLNNIECFPKNHKDIEYEFDFTQFKDKTQLELSVTSLVFVMEDYDRIKDWLSIYGYYVGMPMTIIYSDGTAIDYLLDFSDVLIERIREIEVNIKRFKGWDMFFKNAEGLSFFNPKINWNNSDFAQVDYLVIPRNQLELYISLLISIYVLSAEVARSILLINENIADFIEATTPNASLPPVPSLGDIIAFVILTAARIVLTIALIIALVKLVGQLINAIFPKLRGYKAIRYNKLLEKCCDYLGYNFKSTIMDNLEGLTILPQPTRGDANFFIKMFDPQTLAYTQGFPSVNDTISTLKDAIDEIEKITGGEVRVIGNDVYLEKRGFYITNSNQQVPKNFNLQSTLDEETSINSQEQFKRMVAKYQTDGMDINTYDDTKGTISEESNEIINTPKKGLELITNYTELNINFARGTAKDYLTWMENVAKSFAKAIDTFTGKNLASNIYNRKNVLQISDQYFSTTKLLYCRGNKLVPDQNKYIGTDVILKNNEFRNIENNQRRRVKNMPLEMTEKQMFSILDNNFVNLGSEIVEIEKVSWSESTNIASVDYVIKLNPINEKSIRL